jgi:NAD-dependent deacetylase
MSEVSLLQRAADMLRRARALAVLTGAGVSAESGVPTFRGPDGLWQGVRPEEVATPEAFARDPRFVWVTAVEPNPAHHALAALERRFDLFTLITQNVDGLHRRAGSRNVVEVHGNIWRVRCTGCAGVFDKTGVTLPDLPKCESCGALLRPDVVWFGEALDSETWSAAMHATVACDCLLSVGTSALVYPAAGLADVARRVGAGIVEVNLEATPASRLADVALHGKAGEILPTLVNCLDKISR